MRKRTPRHAQRSLTAVAVLALVFGATGCALDDGTGTSSETARDAFIAVLDSTQQRLGGEWQVEDDPTARGCVIPLWVDGERYPGLRLGPVPDDSTDALNTVTEHWTDLGFTVEETLVGDVVELKAGDIDFDSLIFRVSESGMTLQGESECRPLS